LPDASHCQISTLALATAAQLLAAFTTVIVNVSGTPLLPSVMSWRKNAGWLIIPVRSGYGPAVSSGVTTQFEADIEPPVAVALEVVVELPLTGDDEQPARSAEPARPSVSSSRRLLSLRFIGDVGGLLSRNLAGRAGPLINYLRSNSVEAVLDLRLVASSMQGSCLCYDQSSSR
jgi:hypothetical protein